MKNGTSRKLVTQGGNRRRSCNVAGRMGNLGSFGVGFLAFILLSPVRSEGGGVVDCVSGSECPETPAQCYTLLGWEDVMGPFSCSLWAAFASAVAIGLAVRTIGRLREGVAR